jgi:hypothetical protein
LGAGEAKGGGVLGPCWPGGCRGLCRRGILGKNDSQGWPGTEKTGRGSRPGPWRAALPPSPGLPCLEDAQPVLPQGLPEKTGQSWPPATAGRNWAGREWPARAIKRPWTRRNGHVQGPTVLNWDDKTRGPLPEAARAHGTGHLVSRSSCSPAWRPACTTWRPPRGRA